MADPTKAELLEQANAAGVEADDSMTKAEISAALARAGDGQDPDAGDEADVQRQAEESGAVLPPEEAERALGQDVGYLGEAVDPRPNEAYSQETDPTTSPGPAESRQDVAAGAADVTPTTPEATPSE